MGPPAEQARPAAGRQGGHRRDDRDPGEREAVRQRAARRRGRIGSPSISSATMRNICPRRSTRRGSISIRRRCATSRPSATAGSAASTSSTARSAKAVGQIYVQRHYPPESNRQMGELIANIRAALKEKIENNGWMDAADEDGGAGQARRLRPAHRPSRQVHRLLLAGGEARRPARQRTAGASEFDWKLRLSRFAKPVDRTLWGMTPQTNNAYYDPTQNQITFPAAILQPPYFDPTPILPPITAASARRSVMRSAMASTTRAASSTAPAGCATGGPRPAPSSTISRPHKLVDAVQRLRANSGREDQGRADARRKSRRPRRARDRLRSLPPLRRRAWRTAGDRRPDRRPALLHRLRLQLAAQDTATARFAPSC